MDYGEKYKSLLVSAIQQVDPVRVAEIIECLKEARDSGRRIFVCGSDTGGVAGSKLLTDTLRRSNFTSGPSLRILNLNQQAADPHAPSNDRVFVEQLKNFAEPGDVVIGIQCFKRSESVVKALEYAMWMNCKTILLTGRTAAHLPETSLCLTVGSSHSGTVEDALLSVCHMIGYYFIDAPKE